MYVVSFHLSPILSCINVVTNAENAYQQAVRMATQYIPAPFLPRGRPNASRAAEQTQRSSTFPRRIRSHADRCSRLTR